MDTRTNGTGQLVGPRGKPVSTGAAVSNRLRAALHSDALERQRFSNLMGLQYDKDRDIWEVAGYPDKYKFDDGLERFERQHVAGRIVEMPADTTWKDPPRVFEPDVEDSEFADEYTQIANRLRLTHAWNRLDIMMGLGEYALQLLGFSDVETDRDLRNPIKRGALSGPDDLMFVSQFKQEDVTIKKWVDNPGDPRFGRPDLYEINLSSGVEGFSAGTETVHWSRVVHAAENTLDDEVYGRPRLKRVLNLLHDLEKITAATGESYWQLAAKILVASIDPEATIDDGEMDDLEGDLEDLIHDLRRHFLGQGISLDLLGGDTPDPSDPADMIFMLMAAASGIPKRILFGTETGERASTQDERAWLGSISERRDQFAEPMVVRPFIDRLIFAGVLSEPTSGYEIEWPTLFELDEAEIAETDERRAQTAASLVGPGRSPLAEGVVEVDENGRLQIIPTGSDST